MAWPKDQTAIVGAGWTRFSKDSGASVLQLALEAAKNALDDAGLAGRDVDAVLTYGLGDTVPASEVATGLGVRELGYVLDHYAGGNASNSIVITAAMAVVTGQAKYALCFRALNGRSGFRLGGVGRQLDTTGQDQFLVPYGWTNWAQPFAMFFQRHMQKYGTTPEQLANVALACRKHAGLDDKAMMRKPLTLSEYLAAPFIVEPLRLYDICLETDGACAIVVTSAERARDLRHKPAYLMSGVSGGGPDPCHYTATTSAWMRWREHSELFARYVGPRLFGQAEISPRDVDVAELYDCFSPEVIVQLEDFGFCEKGEGGHFVQGGRIEVGGELPVNTHGGHLSGAYIHGLNHVVEAVIQLRGEGGPRQVKDARVALTTGLGFSVGSAMLLRN
jgi:acetyl-CoA acetyltransferase